MTLSTFQHNSFCSTTFIGSKRPRGLLLRFVWMLAQTYAYSARDGEGAGVDQRRAPPDATRRLIRCRGNLPDRGPRRARVHTASPCALEVADPARPLIRAKRLSRSPRPDPATAMRNQRMRTSPVLSPAQSPCRRFTAGNGIAHASMPRRGRQCRGIRKFGDWVQLRTRST